MSNQPISLDEPTYEDLPEDSPAGLAPTRALLHTMLDRLIEQGQMIAALQAELNRRQ